MRKLSIEASQTYLSSKGAVYHPQKSLNVPAKSLPVCLIDRITVLSSSGSGPCQEPAKGWLVTIGASCEWKLISPVVCKTARIPPIAEIKTAIPVRYPGNVVQNELTFLGLFPLSAVFQLPLASCIYRLVCSSDNKHFNPHKNPSANL